MISILELLGENELMPSLFRRLSKCGSECLAKVLQGMPGSLANGVPQTNEKASYGKVQKFNIPLDILLKYV